MNLVLNIKVNLISSTTFSLSIRSFYSIVLFLSLILSFFSLKDVILSIKKMKNEEKINSNYSDWDILLKMEKNKSHKKII